MDIIVLLHYQLYAITTLNAHTYLLFPTINILSLARTHKEIPESHSGNLWTTY